MTTTTYDRAPITEVAIEVRFASAFDKNVFKKLPKKFEKYYPDLKPINHYNFEVSIINGEPVTNTNQIIDYRLSSNDMSQIVVLKNSSFILSQLAPYKNWEDLISRFERDWKLLKKHGGNHQVARIGVRFINRIDIPQSGSGHLINEDEYLNIYPKQPDILNPFLNYAIQSQTMLEDIKSLLTVNTANIQSPLPRHLSILFDQDIGRTVETPQSTEDILKYLNEVRIKKNAVFESCITNKTRELFKL